jgi:hypothetical protein
MWHCVKAMAGSPWLKGQRGQPQGSFDIEKYQNRHKFVKKVGITPARR